MDYCGRYRADKKEALIKLFLVKRTMKLIMVRHGQTDANISGIIQGHGESSLTFLGKKQAQRIALRLKEEKIDYAYSSDLTRAKETAQEILQFHPFTPIVITEELREVHAGKHEGHPINKDPKIKENYFNHFHEYKPERGESFIEAQQRILGFYNKLIQKHKTKAVLLVGHGGIFGALILALLKRPLNWQEYDKHRPQNAAITILEIEDTKEHTVHLLNCTKHLHELESHNLAEQ